MSVHSSQRKQDPEINADNRIRELLGDVHDAILITDLRGQIIRANALAEELFLLDQQHLCQTSVRKLICGFTDAAYEGVVRSLEDHKPVLLDAVCLRSDQTGFSAEVAIHRIDHTPSAQLCLSIRDVSARKETERQLTEVGEELQRSKQLKSRVEPLSFFTPEVNHPIPDDLPALTPVSPKNRRILIVDDEIVIRQVLAAILHRAFPDFEIDLAANGKEALEIFAQRHHKVLLLDLAMPVMNGEEAFFYLRRFCEEKSWDMPSVIFCTGFAPPETVLAVVRKENLHCYQPKPIPRETLISVVRDCLEIQQLRQSRDPRASASARNA